MNGRLAVGKIRINSIIDGEGGKVKGYLASSVSNPSSILDKPGFIIR
jgi:hypothetical protein